MRSSVSAARRFRDEGRSRTHHRKTKDVHGELASQQFQPLLKSPLEFRPLGGERGRTCRVGPGLHPVQTFWARDGRNLLNNAQLRRLKAELQQPTNTTVDTVIKTQ